jgi:hypothetical protein
MKACQVKSLLTCDFSDDGKKFYNLGHRLLNDRGISGLGTECPDIELPWKTKQVVKQQLAIANRYSVVQVFVIRIVSIQPKILSRINITFNIQGLILKKTFWCKFSDKMTS